MKNALKTALITGILSLNCCLYPYAISHNVDSELPEVTIFVFTSEEEFAKLLKSKATSTSTLKTLNSILPKIAVGSAWIAEATGNGELAPIIRAAGSSLAAASRFGTGPLHWVAEQNYRAAIHKHVKRGNKGAGSKWNWQSIENQYNVSKDNPKGLFVVFLNPTNKEILLTTYMRSNAALGFKAVTNPETKKIIGVTAPFEKRTDTITKEPSIATKDPSILARMFATTKQYYEQPHTIAYNVRDKLSDLKTGYAKFATTHPGSKDKLTYLTDQLDQTKNNIQQFDSAAGKQAAKDALNFFKVEIEAGARLATDPETKDLITRAKAKFNLLKNALEDIILNPLSDYQESTAKIEKAKQTKEEEDVGHLSLPWRDASTTTFYLPAQTKTNLNYIAKAADELLSTEEGTTEFAEQSALFNKNVAGLSKQIETSNKEQLRVLNEAVNHILAKVNTGSAMRINKQNLINGLTELISEISKKNRQ